MDRQKGKSHLALLESIPNESVWPTVFRSRDSWNWGTGWWFRNPLLRSSAMSPTDLKTQTVLCLTAQWASQPCWEKAGDVVEAWLLHCGLWGWDGWQTFSNIDVWVADTVQQKTSGLALSQQNKSYVLVFPCSQVSKEIQGDGDLIQSSSFPKHLFTYDQLDCEKFFSKKSTCCLTAWEEVDDKNLLFSFSLSIPTPFPWW